MSFFNGMDGDEREMLHDLINVFIEKLNVERKRNEDLVREVATMRERVQLLEAAAYGLF
jgi:hypothetical protein